VLTDCPHCGDRLKRSLAHIPGRTLYWCPGCGQHGADVEKVGLVWVEGERDWLPRLRQAIDAAIAWHAITSSDDDDPRWERSGWLD